MGVEFKISLYAGNQVIANQAARKAFDRIEELNGKLSDYDPKSELRKFCQTAGSHRKIPLSHDLFFVLEQSTLLSRKSRGAFDVTVGPIVKLWRRARRRKNLPSTEKLKQARKLVDYRFLKLDRKTQSAELLKKKMLLDLGGIAKGYAADEALEVLQNLGIARALIDASGDIVIGLPPPGKKGWKIALPLPGSPKTHRILFLKNVAVATSGDAFQFVEIEGKRYSHIVDPKTGMGLTHRIQVSVIAKNGQIADSLASALSVLGLQKGIKLAEAQKETEALFVLPAKKQPRIATTSQWKKYERPHQN